MRVLKLWRSFEANSRLSMIEKGNHGYEVKEGVVQCKKDTFVKYVCNETDGLMKFCPKIKRGDVDQTMLFIAADDDFLTRQTMALCLLRFAELISERVSGLTSIKKAIKYPRKT